MFHLHWLGKLELHSQEQGWVVSNRVRQNVLRPQVPEPGDPALPSVTASRDFAIPPQCDQCIPQGRGDSMGSSPYQQSSCITLRGPNWRSQSSFNPDIFQFLSAKTHNVIAYFKFHRCISIVFWKYRN